MDKRCFHCGNDINPADYKMYALDKPYVNLFFHKECFSLVGGYDGIEVYLTQKVEMVYNYCINSNKVRKIDQNGRKKEAK